MGWGWTALMAWLADCFSASASTSEQCSVGPAAWEAEDIERSHRFTVSSTHKELHGFMTPLLNITCLHYLDVARDKAEERMSHVLSSLATHSHTTHSPTTHSLTTQLDQRKERQKKKCSDSQVLVLLLATTPKKAHWMRLVWSWLITAADYFISWPTYISLSEDRSTNSPLYWPIAVQKISLQCKGDGKALKCPCCLQIL